MCATTSVVVLGLGVASSAQAHLPAAFTGDVTTPMQDMGGPYNLAAGDLNGDGRPDAAIVDLVNQSIAVQANNGDGTFTKSDLSFFGRPLDVAIADLNGDGRQDIAAVGDNGDEGVLMLDIQNPLNPFGGFDQIALPAGVFPNALAIGDFNADGRPDIAVDDGRRDADDNYNVLVFTQNRAHGFDETTMLNFHDDGLDGPLAIAAGDLDGDGRDDIVTANGNNDGNTLSLFLKNRRDGFTKKTLATPNRRFADAVAIGDLGGKGKGADIAVGNLAGDPDSVTIFVRDRRDPSGYAQQQLFAPTDGGFFTFNSVVITSIDGKPAIAAANSSAAAKSVTVWTQSAGLRGVRGFTPSVIPTPGGAQGLAAADFDGDRRIDFATSMLQGGVAALIGNTTPAR